MRQYPERTIRLLELLSSAPPECSLVVSSVVPCEWNKHAQEVTEETNVHLAKMEAQSGHFHDACRVLGIDLSYGRARYGEAGLAERLRDLSGRLLDAAIRLDSDDQSSGRAVQRVVRGIPPSRRGGQVQDCTSLEECLAVCQLLQQRGFARKRVFCTSNTSDYCEPNGRLHAGLGLELSAVELTFTTNLNWALHELACT